MASYTVAINSVQDVSGLQPVTLKYVVTKGDNMACYAGSAGLNQTTCTGFTVNIRYLDTTANGTISPGDSIVLTVTPATGHPLLLGHLTVQTADDKILGTVTMS